MLVLTNVGINPGQNPFESIMGGDGMQVQVDERNPNIVYTGYQFGNYYRIDRKSGKNTYIQPKHSLGESPFRFNWQTPILLSKHNQDILYLGGNKLHRSLNQGDDWETISDDLTTGGKKGNVAYGTLTSISESPFQFGLLYTGSDDGLVHITKNGGGSWEKISDNLPQGLWVSRVIASAHQKERVYVTLNGYRFDDFTPYIYVSEDFGKTWKNIGNSIPTSSVNVIKEDPANENILYVGTDNGAYISFDKGDSWEIFNNNLPNVAVHDLVIQEREKHLILGTHGRSLYKAEIGNLQLFTNEFMNKRIHVFNMEAVQKRNNWGSARNDWSEVYEPEMTIPFYVNSARKTTVEIAINDLVINTFIITPDKGYNEVSFDLSFNEKGKKAYEGANKNVKLEKAKNGKFYLPKGTYTVKIEDEKATFEIK